ncbi:MAG: carbohydrate kinase family protein [Candidatus Woesearchaeota archaeon]
MPQSFDIITVGSATMDIFAHTADEHAHLKHIHHATEVCYPLGAKILVSQLEIFTGGGGTNTGVGFSRLGFKTAYLGKLGNDLNAQIILDELKREHVTFIGIRDPKLACGCSVILDSIGEDRTILAYKGANDNLRVQDVDIATLKAQWFYFCSMMNTSFLTQKKLIDYAVKHKMKYAFNPSLYLTKKGVHYLAHILKYAEILIFNKEEAQALLEDTDPNVQNLCMKVAKLGPKIVVITDGMHGANVYSIHDHAFYTARPGKVKIIETTGAGDAFSVGFVAGIMKGLPFEIALKMGMLNAESVISSKGAKNILLDKKLFILAKKDKRVVAKKKI